VKKKEKTQEDIGKELKIKKRMETYRGARTGSKSKQI
jgi:hypothetical protein